MYVRHGNAECRPMPADTAKQMAEGGMDMP